MPRGLPAVWRIGMAVSKAVCLVLLAHLLSSLLGVSVHLPARLTCYFSRALLPDASDPHLMTSAEGSQEHKHFSCCDFGGFLFFLSLCLKGVLQCTVEKPVAPIISLLGV